MQEIQFMPHGDFIELHRLLKATGVSDSGGAGKALVASGAVAVDGRPELRKSAKIRAGQCVTLGDVRIRVLARPSTSVPPPE
ncbi:MAG TPA: RNA-binding S4 domain-containing protein [Casimicrobiaceae bacterium]